MEFAYDLKGKGEMLNKMFHYIDILIIRRFRCGWRMNHCDICLLAFRALNNSAKSVLKSNAKGVMGAIPEMHLGKLEYVSVEIRNCILS